MTVFFDTSAVVALHVEGPLRRHALDALGQQLERGLDRRAVGAGIGAEQVRIGALGAVVHRLLGVAIPPVLVLRVEAAFLDVHVAIAHEHAVVRRVLVEINQLRRVGVIDQEVAVEQAGLDQHMDQRQEQRAVGARLDRHPLIRDRRIAGAHRVDGDELAAVTLELRQRHLHRIGVMVLGGADHHEQLGAVQVRPAELPERPADGVDQAGRHVNRAETAVGRVVRGAELLREQTGQRLHLVAPGEQAELLRVGRADLGEAVFEQVEGLVPGNLLKLARPALRPRLAQQRLGQPRRRVLLHDPGRALGADHALVERVIRVALDVAHLAVPQRHADAATARAHVAGGVLDFDVSGVAI